MYTRNFPLVPPLFSFFPSCSCFCFLEFPFFPPRIISTALSLRGTSLFFLAVHSLLRLVNPVFLSKRLSPSSLAHDPPPPCPNLLVLYILVSRLLCVRPFSFRVFFVGSNPTSPPSNRVCTSSLMHADPMSARETANAACMRVLATCALHFLPRTLLWDARAVLFSFPL